MRMDRQKSTPTATLRQPAIVVGLIHQPGSSMDKKKPRTSDEPIVIDLDPKVAAWERQPAETETAWTTFKAYRDAGEDRTMTKVSESEGKWSNQMTRWSKGFRWRERVLAYDRHMDAIRIKARSRAVNDMTTRHARIASAALEALEAPVLELTRRLQSKAKLVKGMTDKELLAFVRSGTTAIKDMVGVERLARGAPSDVTGQVTATTTAKSLVDAVDDMFTRATKDDE